MARWWNISCLVAGGVSALVSACLSGTAQAQDGALTELYGYGVHRYYAGDLNEAQRVLNIVIDSGIEDPRSYYFRGLTNYKLGMQDAAKSDFEFAADLEARGKKVVNVAYALQRIQGPVRQEIEMARLMARVAVQQEIRAKGQLPIDGSRVAPPLATPPAGGESLPPALATPPAATPATPAAPAGDAQVDPFRDDAAVPAPTTPAPATPAPATPAPAADPFGTAPAAPAPATPAPAAADPFSAPAAPATPAPAGDNPFGT